MIAILRLFVLTLAVGTAAFAQVVGAVDFEVRAALEGSFSDVAVGPEGRIYLLDGKGETVTVLSPDLRRSLAVYDTRKSSGIGRGVAVAVSQDGSFWIADEEGTLAAFDQLGRPQAKLRLPGKGAVGLQRPSAMAIEADGAMIIADGARKTIVVMEPDGAVRSQIRGIQTRGVVFDTPLDIAVDRAGYLHVVDGSGGGVCRLDPWGILRHRWPASEAGPTPFRIPRCVAGDDAGLTFVADASGRCVVMADTSVVAAFGTSGRRPGQINKPVAIAVTPAGDVVIVDADPPRVQVFGVPSLDAVRQALAREDRFLPVRFLAGESWRWDGARIDVRGGTMAVLGADRKTVLLGPWEGGRETLEPVPALAGRVKAASDIALAEDGRIVVADEAARAVWVTEPHGNVVEAVPCPFGAWKSPQWVARSTDGVIVWDRGHAAVARVLGDRQVGIPVRVKDEVMDVAATPSGEIVIVTAHEFFVVNSEGAREAGIASPIGSFGAIGTGAQGLVAALGDAGIAAFTWDGELLALGGIAAGSPASIVRVRDVALDDSRVVALTAEGTIAGYTLENVGRAGIVGVVSAERPDSFSLHLEPVGSGRPMAIRIGPGRFLVGDIAPGDYRWQIRAAGWLTAHGDSTVGLRSQRVADIGTVVMRRAGRAVGRLGRPVRGAMLRAMRGDSTHASASCSDDGGFVLDGLPPGTYDLALEAPGFRPAERLPQFSIMPGTTAEIPALSLIQLGGLKGYVRPLAPDQEVWVLKEGRLARICRPELLADVEDDPTQTLARFECTDLEPGLYELVVRTRGFYPDTTLPQVEVTEGQVARAGTAVLMPAPPDSEGAEGLLALQRALDDYGQARFSTAQDAMQKLLATRSIPYSALDQAYTLVGWCAVARGPSQADAARASFRMALFVNPRLTPGPDASPTVAATMEAVRFELFGEAGPPADLFLP